MTKLSVIIPTFNRSKLVTEAVESVLAQECNHEIEVIVIDDGSQDDTAQVLRKYASRIEYRHQPNRGMNSARNLGLNEATGDYVSFLDSDDAWLPFKAALQIAVMEKLDNVGFAFSNFYAWRNGVRIPDGLGKWMVPGVRFDDHVAKRCSSQELGIDCSGGPFTVKVCEIYRLSLYQPVVLPSTSIVRRHVLDALGPLPEDNWMCGDWEYFARASKAFGAAYIDTETALNRSHDDAVRLMRRALTERTKQRIESIRRTWRADPDFLARFEEEVNIVESNEWQKLFKQACRGANREAAKDYLAEIEKLKGFLPFKLLLLWWLIHIPGSQTGLAVLRGRTR
jgi:glycosyltransferase involved in cell wall biosynthesis